MNISPGEDFMRDTVHLPDHPVKFHPSYLFFRIMHVARCTLHVGVHEKYQSKMTQSEKEQQIYIRLPARLVKRLDVCRARMGFTCTKPAAERPQKAAPKSVFPHLQKNTGKKRDRSPSPFTASRPASRKKVSPLPQALPACLH